MGRSLSSIRREVKELAERWSRTGRALKKEDQPYAHELARMAKIHSNEVFYLFDDPVEAAMFSILVEMLKRIESLEKLRDVDP
jgi:DNA-directed RNA polymerase specialized sigma subunit